MDPQASIAVVIHGDEGEGASLAAVLQSAFRVTVASSPDDAFYTDAGGFQAVVLGLRTSVDRKIDRCHGLREHGYVGGILAVCADAGEGARLLDAGADDFLVTPVVPLELETRLRACIRRAAARSRLRWGSLELDRLGRVAVIRDRSIALTDRECELLAFLIEAGGQVVTRPKLREQLLQRSEDRGSNLVEVHLSRLREKLGDNAAMIETVRGAGYRLRR
ncbi:MAG TPA: response regulator transcription factor [Polyangiaceae bacterium]|nr:response regulator transcription factor [Polyangiaceae bacterium]